MEGAGGKGHGLQDAQADGLPVILHVIEISIYLSMICEIDMCGSWCTRCQSRWTTCERDLSICLSMIDMHV